jgi:NADH:ubiquinone reductase (H+-translocating)
MAVKKPTPIDGVLIVGGGYAGVHAARAAREAGVRATIIDPTGRHDFVTRLAAVAGGTAPSRDASAPLDSFADEVILGRMTSAADGVVRLDDGRRFSAAAVVVAAGAVPARPRIEGLAQASQLRTADDANALRQQIDVAEAVVIVGGGATGVQLAGAIATRHRERQVVLIEASDSLLGGMGRSMGRDAARILRQRGVDVRLGNGIDSIEWNGVVLAGELVEGLPVWAAGFTARAGEFALPVDDQGRVIVDDVLRVHGWECTFAAGDITRHLASGGDVLAMSAQVAVQAGDVAGENAARLLQGRTLRTADLTHVGWVLDLGGHRGLAQLGPLSLTGPFLDLLPPFLHWGIDLKHLIDTRGIGGISDHARS